MLGKDSLPEVMAADGSAWQYSIPLIGATLLTLSLVQFAVDPGERFGHMLEVLLPLALSTGLLWYGVVLARDTSFDEYKRVLGWCLLGCAAFLIFGLWTSYLLAVDDVATGSPLNVVLSDGTIGAVVGTVVGRSEAGQRSARQAAVNAMASLDDYREIFENVDEGIVVNDASTGTIVDTNPYFADMLGYDREELRGMRIVEISADEPEYDHEAAMERIGTALAGDPQTFDWLVEHRDGTPIWVEVSLKATTVGEEDRLVAVVRDIEDRRAREQQIRQQKQQLDTLVENLPVILFAVDDDGEIFISEGRGLASLGLESGELVGESVYEVYEDVPAFLEVTDRALDGESVQTTVSLDGKVFETWFTPVFDGESVDHVIGTAMDITERRDRKQQLAELHDASRRLTYATTREEAGETAVQIAEDVLDMPVSTLWRFDADGDCLVPVAMTDSSKDILGVDDVDGLDPITDDELGMEVFRSGETWSTDDYKTIDHAAFDVPLGNVILVPLGDHGLLEVGKLAVEETNEETLERARILGLNATTALDRIDRERELERAQERFRALSENSPVGIVTIDDSSIVQFANPAIGDILGFDPGDLVDESITKIIPERLEEDHRAGVQRYLDTGERQLDWSGIELPARHADGHEIDVEVSFGELAVDDKHLFTGIVRDISERKQQERQIRALQKATLELAETSTVEEIQGMAVEIASEVLNHPLAILWRYDPDEELLVPQAMTDKVGELLQEHEIDDEPVCEDGSPEMRAFRSGETIVAEQYQNPEGGVELPLGTAIIAPVDDYGVLGFATHDVQVVSESDRYLSDILASSVEAALDRTHQEALLRERTEELEIRTSQMEFINSIIRHDVLNGMTVIRSRAEVMSDDLEGQQEEYAETIVNWCDNITGLAERVQTVVKTLTDKQSVDLEPIDVTRLVDEEFTRLDQTYPGVTFERDLPEEVLVKADELLADVVGNVATNAIEHNDREDLIVSASVRVEGDRAVVRIADNGKGIPPDELESVFRRGETHAKTAGSGFGLFFVDAMMEAYGGDVWVENDDGAVFVLELPLFEESPKRDEQ